jgi:hypothetical protein
VALRAPCIEKPTSSTKYQVLLLPQQVTLV